MKLNVKYTLRSMEYSLSSLSYAITALRIIFYLKLGMENIWTGTLKLKWNYKNMVNLFKLSKYQRIYDYVKLLWEIWYVKYFNQISVFM